MEKRKVRFFNTTGPCNPFDHYMLPPEERYLFIFGRRKKKPSWGERLKWLAKDEITIVGC
ncbi:hypothetical protein [Leadbettera azotonutricia]|uniref:Uncharacterized protein n=1 Tax=Leadbettera azotonutricia (strain ATCC BAA-888 / DSM 13862 / ZAS-9) TaxID=545695 RepID=F5YCB9_LEAAZ|nr:hypothetical protein [Leadbettera azotonutricia]AEF80341.1 conserved hypothetical protein [Leadbettera azotonutricia ZAS-9]